MKVKNDFPDVDRVLSKLRQYVSFFEEKKGKEISEDDANENLQEVDNFINAIENYLDSVCNDEEKIRRFRDQRDSIDEVQKYIEQLDEIRTMHHSTIIASMVVIDRIAQINGLNKVFDYAEEFEKDCGPLLVNDRKKKELMTERQRIKRREMGNFGLYIAASATVGLEMSDREMRDFASTESDNININSIDNASQAYYDVKSKVKKSSVSKNINDMLR